MKSVVFAFVLGTFCAADNVLQTKPGQTATLQCGITDTTSILKWQRGRDLLYSTNPRTGVSLKGKGQILGRTRLRNEKNLEISPVTLQDAGLFTCSVKAQEEQHRLVVASVSVTPSTHLEEGAEAVLQCDVAGLPQGSSVEWVRPVGGQREGGTRLHMNSVSQADAGPWQCVFSAYGKTMSETVTLQVTDPRLKTTAAPSTTRTTEVIDACVNCTDSPPPGPALWGLSWWVWAAVGGGCLVIILWVLILIMYNQMRRRKTIHEDEEDGPVENTPILPVSRRSQSCGGTQRKDARSSSFYCSSQRQTVTGAEGD